MSPKSNDLEEKGEGDLRQAPRHTMKALKTWEPRPESSALRHSSTWDARSRQKLEEMWEDSDGDALQVLDLRPPEL